MERGNGDSDSGDESYEGYEEPPDEEGFIVVNIYDRNDPDAVKEMESAQYREKLRDQKSRGESDKEFFNRAFKALNKRRKRSVKKELSDDEKQKIMQVFKDAYS